MKYLLLAMLMLSACSHTTKTSKSKDLVLLEARVKQTVSGKEQLNGKSLASNYTLIFKQQENLSFTHIWIHKTAYAFETFAQENNIYLSAKVYGDNTENVLSDKLPITSEAEGVVAYELDGVLKYLEIEKFEKAPKLNAQ